MKIEEGKYKCEPHTTVCDFDANGNLTLFAFLKFQQQAAEEQATMLGYGYDAMVSHGMAFLVNKSMNVIEQMPRYTDKFYINTWCAFKKGVRFYRMFEWFKPDGTPLAYGCNTYVLVSVDEHKPLRPSALYGELKDYPEYSSPALDYVPKMKADNMQSVGTYTVQYTDLDVNNHLNNARYANILQNNIPKECRENIIKSFAVDFVRELAVDSKVELMSVTENGSTIMEGVFDGITRFRGRVDYL